MSLGRELLGLGDRYRVERFRGRLFGSLGLGPGKGKTLLDLGCGDGLEAGYFTGLGYKVHAVDLEEHPNWKKLKLRFKGKARFIRADASALSMLKKQYDVVFQKDMLHHADDPAAVLREMKRLLKPGGKLLVLESNRFNPVFYLRLTLLLGHEHFSRARLRRLMGAAGLPSWQLALREARVWPWDSKRLQDAADWVQDRVEALPFLRPMICYHIARWEKPGRKGKKP